MAEWDASPTLNEATGLPYSFQQVPRQTHVSLWASAASMVLPQSRYAALLVSLHGTALYEAYDPATGSPEDAEACATISDASSLSSTSFSRRSAQTRATRRTRQTRALRAIDASSRGSTGSRSPVSRVAVRARTRGRAHRGRRGDDRCVARGRRRSRVRRRSLAVSGRGVALRYEGRRLDGRFTDDEAMRAAFGRAPWVTLTTRLRP
jgi:Protein of unknown function (DUF3891)